MTIKNKDLFEVWVSAEKSDRERAVLLKILTFINTSENSNDIEKECCKVSHFFCLSIVKKWHKCARIRDRFLRDYSEWLEQEIYLTEALKFYIEYPSSVQNPVPGPSRGRPQLPFQECSTKTKKRRVEKLVKNYSFNELSFATQQLSAPSKSVDKSKVFSPQQALALYLDLSLTERKYNILRSTVNTLHKDCFPRVAIIREYRNQLLPRSINITECSAEVNLQELLNFTVQSILKTLQDSSNLSEVALLELVCKYGFDGSSGHSTYKQKFKNPEMTDEYLFLIALSPIQLLDKQTGHVIWANPRTSSTFFCRPIKFIFAKETSQLVLEEESKIKNSINNLSDFKIAFEEKSLCVSYRLLLTMLDGSTINTLSNTNAAQKCFICCASPKEMNLEAVTKKPVKLENFNFGLSSLHSWIRCFECFLHISYRLPLKTWQVRGSVNKEVYENRKNYIQTEFKAKLGLIVDKPKPGYGSTNDGNTARRFFSNVNLSSSITGVDKELITKFSIILRTIASGKKINIVKFGQLLDETRTLYLKLYDWYYMPSSVHKLLVHGKDIIQNFDIPIGKLAEDALEARHKEIRKFRLSHSRKTSRVNTNRDIMTSLLITSDPFISSLRKNSSRYKEDLSGIEEYIIEYPTVPEDNDFDFPMMTIHSDDENTSSTDSE